MTELIVRNNNNYEIFGWIEQGEDKFKKLVQKHSYDIFDKVIGGFMDKILQKRNKIPMRNFLL